MFFCGKRLSTGSSKTLEDNQGKIYSHVVYAYDMQGNQIEKKVLEQNGSWVTYKSQYRPDGKILKEEDPLGNVTTWNYDHHHINDKGQTVLACTMRDPLDRITHEIYDTYGRIAKKELFDNDILASRTMHVYNKKGLETKRKASVYFDGKKLRDYWVRFEYNCRGLNTSETEMPAEKTTLFAYNELGQLTKKTYPNGSWVNYTMIA